MANQVNEVVEKKIQYVNKVAKEDVQHVAAVAEQVLRCSIFRLLEKVIDQESAEGQLDFSSIPQNILEELRIVKENLKSCELDGGNNVDKWFIHKAFTVLNKQIDVIVKSYHKTFYKLTIELDLTDEFSFAYDTFVAVCKKMFRAEITWYHIVALLCFGSEIAVFVIKQGKPGVKNFLEKVVHYVVEFMIKEEIAEWITMHGGWVR